MIFSRRDMMKCETETETWDRHKRFVGRTRDMVVYETSTTTNHALSEQILASGWTQGNSLAGGGWRLPRISTDGWMDDVMPASGHKRTNKHKRKSYNIQFMKKQIGG
jgi:hypothetical protein